MMEIIDLTVSPRHEVIEISSDQDTSGHRNQTQENRTKKKKKEATFDDPASDGSSTWPPRTHSPEIGSKRSGGPNVPSISLPKSATQSISSPITDGLGLFFIDDAAAPIIVEDISSTPEPPEFNKSGNELLLPSHVAVFRNDELIPAGVIPAPKSSSDDEEYIEYLDYEDRKAPGLVRYFEVEGEETSQSRPSVFICKNCGAEGDHRTYECPIQICLTCGARDEHSTRSCPISKTCYTCGMKGHINKTCPNRFSAYTVSPDVHGDCDRCGSTEHRTNECPTLWRIYQYVHDEERVVIMQSREEKKRFAIGEGGEGYIGKELWCYNCANVGHLGDDCDELPYPVTFPAESSAFSSHNVITSPFYDPATEPVSVNRRSSGQDGKVEWDAGAPVDVGKRGKNKDRERLEKRFREQEDKAEDWFDDVRNTKRRGTDQQVPRPGPQGRTLKFRLIKDRGHDPSSPLPSLPPGANEPSLLSRLSDTRGGRNRGESNRRREQSESSHQSKNPLRIRGAATDQGNLNGRYAGSRKIDCERGQDRRDRGEPGRGGSRRGHGPRYRGGYDR